MIESVHRDRAGQLVERTVDATFVGHGLERHPIAVGDGSPGETPRSDGSVLDVDAMCAKPCADNCTAAEVFDELGMVHNGVTLRNIASRVNMICSATMCDIVPMVELDTLGERLRWARERAGYVTAADFAKAAKLKPVTYRAYEADQNSAAKLAHKLADLLNVPTDWLLRGGPVPEAATHAMSEVMPTGVHDVSLAKWGEAPLPPVPLVGTAMGGEWDDIDQLVELTEVDLGEILDYVRRPISLRGDANAYAVTIVGDSMYPRFRPGRRLIVTPKAVPSIGDDVVVQLLGAEDGNGDRRVVRALIKELARRTSTYVELRQFNPDITFRVDVSKIAAIHKVAGELF